MISFLSKRLKLKLLIILALILALSFTIISLSIIKTQNRLLSALESDVNAQLNTTAQKADKQLRGLETFATNALGKMTDTAVQGLSTRTAAALDQEEAVEYFGENHRSIRETNTIVKASAGTAGQRTGVLITWTGVLCGLGAMVLMGFSLGRLFIRPVTGISRGMKDIAQVEDLGMSAREIEKVVESITDISEQVNLLSLNATTEIKKRVERIQQNTGGTVEKITSISTVSGITREIKEVGSASAGISAKAGEVSNSARDLESLSKQQNRVVGKFKI